MQETYTWKGGGYDNTATTTIAGNVSIDPGATLQNMHIFHVGGNWTNDGDYLANGAMIVFDGSGTQSISASTFNNFIIDKPVGSVAELTGNIVINGDFTVQSGTFDIKTFDCNRSSLGDSFTLAADATFIVGGNNPPFNFASGSLDNASTVIADGTSSQIIFASISVTLSSRNAGAKTLVPRIPSMAILTVKGVSNSGREYADWRRLADGTFHTFLRNFTPEQRSNWLAIQPSRPLTRFTAVTPIMDDVTSIACW